MFNEFKLSSSMILEVSGLNELMENTPVNRDSVKLRERIVLPLITIQQFAISRIREIEEQIVNNPMKEKYEKLEIRSSFGIINAGRNSA